MLTMVYNLKSHVIKQFSKTKYYNIILREPYSTKSYKLLFFGSDGIALSSLRKINEFRKKENHLIECVDLVTTDLKYKTDIIKYAQAEGLKTITWPLHELRAADYDMGLIVAFGHLIKEDLLKKFPFAIIRNVVLKNLQGERDLSVMSRVYVDRGMVNVHPSLLPRWRGAAPIIHTLLNGDSEAGVSLMKIQADIFDVGEIISQVKVPISKDIRLPELTEQLSEIGAEMLVECIRKLPASLTNIEPQSSNGVTYAKKINKSISEVRWTQMSAAEVYNLYRAIYGLFPLTTLFQNKQMKLFDAFIHNLQEIEHSDKPVGTIEYCKHTKAIRILCKDRRYIYFKSLRIVGKRQISALDFYNGYIKNVPLQNSRCTVLRCQ